MGDPSYLPTLLGWGALVAGGVGYYIYTSGKTDQRKPQKSIQKRVSELPPASSNAKSRPKKKLAPSVSAKSSTPNTPPPSSSSLTYPAPPPPTHDETKEDMTWTKDLLKARKGTTITNTTKKEKFAKTVKLSNANRVVAELSGSTSTNGDAEDNEDNSSQWSTDGPLINPSGINDMLEESAPGPSVLRIKQDEYPQPVRKQKDSKAPKQQEETKKQRQNRKKAEEKKILREEDERIRRQLEEKQRRTARESRGEPAKNGMAATPASVSNAWMTTKPPVYNDALLDTFEASAESIDKDGKAEWSQQSLPSEEEQMRLLVESDDTQWQTVSKGKKTRKNTAVEEDEGGAVQAI